MAVKIVCVGREMGLIGRVGVVVLMGVLTLGCARKPSEIQAHVAEPSFMAGASCAQLKQARNVESVELARWELPVVSAYKRDRWAVAFGLIGSLFGLRGDGPEHGYYAAALGRRQHIDGLIAKQGC